MEFKVFQLFYYFRDKVAVQKRTTLFPKKLVSRLHQKSPKHDSTFHKSNNNLFLFLQEIMMDHALRTISYIADIGDLLVIMARRRPTPTDDVQVRKSALFFLYIYLTRLC